MPVVHFVPLGKSCHVTAGATILAAANRSRVPLGQSCGGVGICGWCKVRLMEGGSGVASPSATEDRLRTEKGFGPDERAACLARVEGNATITTDYW